MPSALLALQAIKDTEQRRAKLKEQMAISANKLLQHPEGHVSELRVLNALVGDGDKQIARLAMLSQLAVMKDVLPGYRIRLSTEKELLVKVRAAQRNHVHLFGIL